MVSAANKKTGPLGSVFFDLVVSGGEKTRKNGE